jgi:hypothetical protein
MNPKNHVIWPELEQPTTIYIGIDPGVMTGYAEIIDGKYVTITQSDILTCINKVITRQSEGYDICLHVENPNQRTFYKKGADQGAGSIKRDYTIWKDAAEKHKIRFFPITPASIGSSFNNITVFHAATGWSKKAGKHARDAAKIIFKFKK